MTTKQDTTQWECIYDGMVWLSYNIYHYDRMYIMVWYENNTIYNNMVGCLS